MRSRTIIMLLSATTMATACMDGKGGTFTQPVTTTTQMSSSVTTANSKVSSITNLIGNSSAFVYVDSLTDFNYEERATGVNAVWATDPGVPPLSNTGTSSLKTWMASQFNPNFANNNGANITFSGRISSALQVFCYIGESGVPFDSSNLPVAGTYTKTLTSEMGARCGNTNFTEMSVTMTISNTTNTTYYDRLVSVKLPNRENCPFVFYGRYNSQAINLAQAEDQQCDGRDQASKTVFHYNSVTKIAKFLYISQAFSSFPSGFEIYRGYLDETTDVARMLGFYGGDDNGDSTFSSGVGFSVVGKPSAGGTAALSAKVLTGATIAAGTYNGCVNTSTINVDTDNSLACTVTGTDVDAPYASVIQGQYNANSSRADIYNINETTTPGFTNATDMYN